MISGSCFLMVILLKKRGIENSGPALKTSSFDGKVAE